jgi:hypothetical protein
MGVLWQGFNENIAIELELTGKSSSRYKHIFRQYRYKESLLGVWYLVPTNTLGQQIKNVWNAYSKADSRPYFFWSLYEDVIKNKENALIHLANSPKKISDVWTVKNAECIAHMGAHHVSRVSDKTEVKELAVTVS